MQPRELRAEGTHGHTHPERQPSHSLSPGGFLSTLRAATRAVASLHTSLVPSWLHWCVRLRSFPRTMRAAISLPLYVCFSKRSTASSPLQSAA